MLCSMERELQSSRKVVQELLKIPKALMERLTKWTTFKFLFCKNNNNNNYDH